MQEKFLLGAGAVAVGCWPGVGVACERWSVANTGWSLRSCDAEEHGSHRRIRKWDEKACSRTPRFLCDVVHYWVPEPAKRDSSWHTLA